VMAVWRSEMMATDWEEHRALGKRGAVFEPWGRDR
jgi:hypothetical protein